MMFRAGEGVELDVIFCGHGVDGMEHTLRYLVTIKVETWGSGDVFKA